MCSTRRRVYNPPLFYEGAEEAAISLRQGLDRYRHRLRDLLRADAPDRAGGRPSYRHPGGSAVLRRPLPPHRRPRPLHVLPPPAVPQELPVPQVAGVLLCILRRARLRGGPGGVGQEPQLAPQIHGHGAGPAHPRGRVLALAHGVAVRRAAVAEPRGASRKHQAGQHQQHPLVLQGKPRLLPVDPRDLHVPPARAGRGAVHYRRGPLLGVGVRCAGPGHHAHDVAGELRCAHLGEPGVQD
mmetsp:Transcript_37148/g.80876  ORF Transcript_37148/g.80876 Transcript_37148/m.80876 type:complete len:240 (+) Transcript_37148:936-1655(+)